MALHAMNGNRAGERTAPPDLDHVAKRVRVGWFTDDRCIPAFAALFCPFEQFHRAVDGRAFLIAGDEKGNAALDVAMLFDVAGNRGHETGDAAFHVHRATAIHHAVLDFCGKGRVLPVLFIAGRHDIGVACEHQMWPIAGFAGIEIFNIGRVVIAENGAVC